MHLNHFCTAGPAQLAKLILAVATARQEGTERRDVRHVYRNHSIIVSKREATRDPLLVFRRALLQHGEIRANRLERDDVAAIPNISQKSTILANMRAHIQHAVDLEPSKQHGEMRAQHLKAWKSSDPASDERCSFPHQIL